MLFPRVDDGKEYTSIGFVNQTKSTHL